MLLHVLSGPLTRGELDRNSALGIRTRATKASDEAWHDGHRAAGPWLRASMIAGYAFALAACVVAVALLTAGRQSGAPMVIAFLGYVVVVALLGVATVKANAAARPVTPTR